MRAEVRELLDAVAGGDVELDDAIDRLVHAEWTTWPVEERDAVLARLVELWRSEYRIDLLDDLTSAGADPARLLGMVPEDLAPQRIAELLREMSYTGWRDRRVVAWLSRVETAELMEEAFLGTESDTLGVELYWAITELDLLS